MGLPSILVLAVGLSMDAFAVSISSGARTRQHQLVLNALVIALFFGAFQALMPALGWAAGCTLCKLIDRFDHWIAFGLLSAIGGKMIFESLAEPGAEDGRGKVFSLTFSLMLTLSIATSIDALAVGLSLSLLKMSILLPVLIIGTVTFFISAAGVFIGHKCGQFFGKKFELIGGMILIGIGVSILIDHLL